MHEIAEIEQALRRAAPHRLVGVVEDALREYCGAPRVELRLADYGLRTLQLVGHASGAEPSVPIHDSPQGRAFGSQEPVVVRDDATGKADAHLPVTIRGDRMGVLSVRLPADCPLDAVLPEMRHICEALGHEILVA